MQMVLMDSQLFHTTPKPIIKHPWHPELGNCGPWMWMDWIKDRWINLLHNGSNRIFWDFTGSFEIMIFFWYFFKPKQEPRRPLYADQMEEDCWKKAFHTDKIGNNFNSKYIWALIFVISVIRKGVFCNF
jgi:hypothetical protein